MQISGQDTSFNTIRAKPDITKATITLNFEQWNRLKENAFVNINHIDDPDIWMQKEITIQNQCCLVLHVNLVRFQTAKK